MERLVLMTKKITEQDLLKECKNGDREAFNQLFRSHHKRVFSVAINFFGGNQQIAEDITQQVFLKLYVCLDDFRGDAKLATWLYRITVNSCIDEQKKNYRLSFISDLFKADVTGLGLVQEERIHREEISDEIQKAIGSLKVKFRLPILLKYSEELSYREMAEVLDCSEGTIASRLNRGLKLLARKLEHLKEEL